MLSRHHHRLPLTRFFSSTTTTVPPPPPPRPTRVVVVGAGVAGLSVLERLSRRRGVDVVAIERHGDVGGVWRDNYKGMALQVGKELFEFPQQPWAYPETAPVLPPATHVQEMVKQFAIRNDLMKLIRFNSAVENVKQDEVTGKWTLNVVSNHNNTVEQMDADYVIMCSGLFNEPFIPPEIQQRHPNQTTPVIHGSEFKHSEQVNGKNVVVIGAGKSASEVALQAHQSGATSVTLLFREAHWGVPLKILNLIPFHWIFLSRFGQTLVEMGVGPWPTRETATMKTVHDFVAPVMRPVFKLVSTLFALQLGQTGDRRPQTDLVNDLYGYAAIYTNDFKKNLNSKDGIRVVKGEMSWVDGQTKTMGVIGTPSQLPCDVVIAATGFLPKYDQVFAPDTLAKLDLASDGLWLARGMFPANVNNLAFVGSTLTVSNIMTSAIQAEYVARVVCGEVKTGIWNSPELKKKEVAMFQAWKRAWMPNTTSRASMALLHMTSYHDSLMRDMGESPRRKSNPVSETIAWYGPLDYAGVFKG